MGHPGKSLYPEIGLLMSLLAVRVSLISAQLSTKPGLMTCYHEIPS